MLQHTFRDGILRGVDSPPAGTLGFDGFVNTTLRLGYQRSESERVGLECAFEFLNHRDGKDIYSIRMTFREHEKGSGTGVSEFPHFIEYDGSPLTLYDHRLGVTKLMSRKLAIDENGKFVDGSKPVN